MSKRSGQENERQAFETAHLMHTYNQPLKEQNGIVDGDLLNEDQEF